MFYSIEANDGMGHPFPFLQRIIDGKFKDASWDDLQGKRIVSVDVGRDYVTLEIAEGESK